MVSQHFNGGGVLAAVGHDDIRIALAGLQMCIRDRYIPLIGAIFALSIGCNLISVIGLWSPTADLNTEAAWALSLIHI